MTVWRRVSELVGRWLARPQRLDDLEGFVRRMERSKG